MSALKQESRAIRSRRTASIFQIETDLIRRFEGFLNTWLESAPGSKQLVTEIASIREFSDTFVENFHFRRVELALARWSKLSNHRRGIWLDAFAEHQVRFRARLEGINQRLDTDEAGGLTLFAWGATALSRTLAQYLWWAENVLLPGLRTRVSEQVDAAISDDLNLDQPEEVEAYAQAESLVLVMSGE